MADQLYLSYRLRGFTENNMLRHYEKMLRQFPFSQLSQSESVYSMFAVSWAEPPLIERALPPPIDLNRIVSESKENLSADVSVQLESCWDLWQYSDDWKLTPAPVMLSCFGPRFESEADDHLRIGFGLDARFLPQSHLPNSAFMVQSNVRSLLHLVKEMDGVLAVEQRRLWSESGENFAGRLQAALVSG